MYPNVLALDDQRIATPNLAPGTRVYDEDLLTIDGVEWRTWNPMRSKLGSYIVKGGRNFPLQRDSKVVYLGAANGTTPSHVSDIVREGVLVAVEFSPRSFRDLMRVAADRPNMLPILADAWRPELYERFVGKVDLLFQDIAQRQQAQIFAKNLTVFRPSMGILAVKARSVDVAANPRDVYEQVAAAVESLTEYRVIETVDLGPFERDHAALVVVPGEGGRKPARQQERREERPQREERPRFDRGDRPQR
ncbi:MAG TPA: fibrillarin-like rRNA/tRNA 2'-O-methyltransferase, partial [Candidatus Thermoplasmatota archaeon]|nr:fibrillarin-like rRNA/tRNA 2'-O-methyltransferase [Candidatus Thermoplasmatota archaeon]